MGIPIGSRFIVDSVVLVGGDEKGNGGDGSHSRILNESSNKSVNLSGCSSKNGVSFSHISEASRSGSCEINNNRPDPIKPAASQGTLSKEIPVLAQSSGRASWTSHAGIRLAAPPARGTAATLWTRRAIIAAFQDMLPKPLVRTNGIGMSKWLLLRHQLVVVCDELCRGHRLAASSWEGLFATDDAGCGSSGCPAGVLALFLSGRKRRLKPSARASHKRRKAGRNSGGTPAIPTCPVETRPSKR